jgi:hypothetical protein
MTFLNDKTGEYSLEARTQANLPALCLHCNRSFKQNAEAGIYGLTFCGPCIQAAGGKMPNITFPVMKLDDNEC